MKNRVAVYLGKHSLRAGTSPELLVAAVEAGGSTVGAIFVEDGTRRGRGPQTAWGRLIADLAGVDQIVVATAADLPGWTIPDLLRLLDILRQAGVALYCHAEGIGTDGGATAILDLIAAYRRAKLGQAVRRGQGRARAAGQHIGRPPIPAGIRQRVLAALATGSGIRPTAKKFGISPATVINIRSMAAEDRRSDAVAA